MVIKTENSELFLIEVPKNGFYFRYKKMPDSKFQLVCSIKDDQGNEGTCYINNNPVGNILGLLINLNEEQCKKFVQSKRIKKSWMSSMSNVYVNYTSDHFTNKYTEMDHESFVSLLELNGVDTSKKLLVIELT